MIYTVTLNPALDKTVEIPGFQLNTVNRIQTLRTDPGGKGINVSKVINKLGGESIAVGILGGDTGRSIENALKRDGLKTDFLYVNGETRTNLKVVDPVNHTNTDINEPGVQVDETILKKTMRILLTKMRTGDIVVLSGSLPHGAPKDTYRIWVETLKLNGAKVFLDADGELLSEGLKAAPYLVKPNNDELSRLCGRKLETVEELAAAATELLNTGVKKVVLSMGGRGALYVTNEITIYAEGLKVSVGSTVGAGDSMVAALAYAEEKGFTLEETVCLSTATGAANVMCSGTQAAEYESIRPLIKKVNYRILRSI